MLAGITERDKQDKPNKPNKPNKQGQLLVVVDRTDEVGWRSLRNIARVHVIVPDQLNAYDVLVCDHVVFTETALADFVEARQDKPGQHVKQGKQGAQGKQDRRGGGRTRSAATASAGDDGSES